MIFTAIKSGNSVLLKIVRVLRLEAKGVTSGFIRESKPGRATERERESPVQLTNPPNGPHIAHANFITLLSINICLTSHSCLAIYDIHVVLQQSSWVKVCQSPLCFGRFVEMLWEYMVTGRDRIWLRPCEKTSLNWWLMKVNHWLEKIN